MTQSAEAPNKIQEVYMKKLMTMAAMILMVFALSACGDKSAEDDPNLGMYEAKSVEMMGLELNIEDAFEDGFKMELKKNGKGRLYYDGDDAGFKWELDGEKFHAKGGGAELDATLKDGVMVIDNLMDSGMKVTLVNEEAVAKAKAGSGSETENSTEEAGSEETGEKSESSKLNKLFSDDASSESSDSGDGNGSGSLLSGAIGELDDGEGGNFDLYIVEQDGKTYMQDELKARGIDGWVKMNNDGTGTVKLGDHTYDMTWGDGKIVVPNGDDGREEYIYSFANEYLVIPDGDTIMTFIKSE